MTSMKSTVAVALVAAGLSVAANLRAADYLRLNQRLNNSSDSQDGPLITGDSHRGRDRPGQAQLRFHVRRGLIQFQAAGSPLRKPL